MYPTAIPTNLHYSLTHTPMIELLLWLVFIVLSYRIIAEGMGD